MTTEYDQDAEKPLRLFKGIRENSNSEQEQAYMRFFLGLVVFVYLFLTLSPSGNFEDHATRVLWVSGLFMLYSSIIIGMTLHSPVSSDTRRWVCLVIDFTTISIGMHLADELGPILYTVMLWSIFGYGIRYGMAYLISASMFATAGYLMVITSTPFWVNNPALSIGLLLGLIILPVFVYALLNIIHQEKAKSRQARLEKDSLIANISHELRSPLNGIIAMGNLIDKANNIHEQREYANTIQASAQSLLNIVDDILDISKHQKLSVKNVEFDLHGVINTVTSMYKQQARAKGLNFYVEIDSSTPGELIGDSELLRQVLIHLVGNAIKFTPKGFIKLKVSQLSSESEHINIKFEIVDTGIGIPFQQQHEFLESFKQKEAIDKGKHDSLSLGATISHNIVKLMGGDISLKSIPGSGTTFIVTLPFIKNFPTKDAASAGTAARRTAEAEVLNPVSPHAEIPAKFVSTSTNASKTGPRPEKKVLIATSKKSTCELLGYYLAVWNMDAYYTNNASDAFSKLLDMGNDGSRYDEMIIEEAGIDIDAIQFARAIMGEVSIHKPKLTLILNANSKHHERYLNNGYSSTIQSPVKEKELFQALHQVSVPTVVTTQSIKQPPPGQRTLSILIAEDNKVSQRVIGRILEQLGHHYKIIDNGLDALSSLLNKTYDLAIIDLHMPDLSGVELANRFKAARTDVNTPLIMLTANVSNEAQMQCKQAGISAFLTKPVKSKDLQATINTVLSGGEVYSSKSVENTTHEVPVIDSEALKELISLDAGNGFLNRLCTSFEEDAESLLENIRSEIGHADYETIKELIHALKGSAGNVGASSFHERCAYYCDMSKNEFLDHQKMILPDLHRQFTEARHALREYIEEYNYLSS